MQHKAGAEELPVVGFYFIDSHNQKQCGRPGR